VMEYLYTCVAVFVFSILPVLKLFEVVEGNYSVKRKCGSSYYDPICIYRVATIAIC